MSTDKTDLNILNNEFEIVKLSPSSPFADLKFADFSPLSILDERTQCPKCNGRRKFFCYYCSETLGPQKNLIPHLYLPIKCIIIHYITEDLAKSTAAHAKILAPESVEILDFPNELRNFNLNETVILYPSDDAISVDELDFKNLKQVLFVDSQWRNAKKVLRDERFAKIKHVKIKNHETRFWRWQKLSKECLATIEAIYYFYKEYVTHLNEGQYNGEMDNLLYYFAWFYNLVQSVYKSSGKKFRRIEDYIQ